MRLFCTSGVAPARRVLAAALFLSLIATSALAAPATVDFAREVHPIFQRACFECHGPEVQKSRLRLDSRAGLLKGGINGPIVLAGQPDRSELLRRVSLPKGHADLMPNRGEPLAKADLATLRAWIAEGASWPETFTVGKHWAYVKPTRPPTPPVRPAASARNPIDHFVLARLEREGQQASAEAGKAELLRRVSLDLIGLPPTPAQVAGFLADASPPAYERAVDRLLASPQYGERWARPWLDLARYADSHGFQRDDLREAWPYRDWVIRALNADLPYERFTIEQIAGDLLPDATVDQKIATGFHRCAPCNVEAGTDQEENRVNQVFDRVNTTASVWLGTTLECAQCHDHKYDPFPQRDYYALFAFFNNTVKETEFTSPKAMAALKFTGPFLTVPDPAKDAARVNLERQLAELAGRLQARSERLAAERPQWEQRLAATAQETAQAHALEVADFDSLGDSNHKVLADKSILLLDDVPDKDTYVLTVHTRLTGITGFKLETLTDSSLPGNGPGRGDAQRPNFVLNNFTVTVAPADQPKTARPLKFVAATASFSQANLPVANLLKSGNDARGGWAINPQFHKPHWAQLVLAAPLNSAGELALTFRLEQNYGSGRTIGRVRLSAITGNPAATPLPSDLAEILRVPAGHRTAAQSRRLADYQVAEDQPHGLMRLNQANLEKELRNLGGVRTLVMQEGDAARPTAILRRGNFLDRGDPVPPGVPAILHPLRSVASAGSLPTRLDLARWLVDRENPLTARVAVNRWWAEFFGRGLVNTPEDFGLKGELPSHPELLDWLAVELMEPAVRAGELMGPSPRAWSMKHLHKLIVMSATYRQSSRVTPEALARDDQNQWLARGARFRLSAEAIRDNALAAAGLLSLKPGGPPVYPYQPAGLWDAKVGGDKVSYELSTGEDAHRRGIYTVWKRASPYPSFMNFDATARTACVIQRSRSNTPLQALTLLNDPVYVEAAEALAKRVWSELPAGSVEERLAHAFRLCVARAPRPVELNALKQLLEGQPGSESARWQAVAAVLLNLDEMITKG